MKRIPVSIDSHIWTGEEDYVEVEILSVALALGALAFLLIGLLL